MRLRQCTRFSYKLIDPTLNYLPKRFISSSNSKLFRIAPNEGRTWSSNRIPANSSALKLGHDVHTLKRCYQSMASGSDGPNSKSPAPAKSVVTPVAPSTPKNTPNPSSSSAPVDLGGDTVHKTNAEQRKADWRIVKNLIGTLWPKRGEKDAWSVKSRVVIALGLLIGGKVIFYFSSCYWTEYEDQYSS